MDAMAPAARLQELNDSFRRTLIGGSVVMAASLQRISDAKRKQVLQEVRDFSAWAPDAEGDHAYGEFTLDDLVVQWRIDAYSSDMTGLSPDPMNECATRRMLVIQLAAPAKTLMRQHAITQITGHLSYI